MSGAIPLKDHGVYTVFVDLGNTKIEVSVLFHRITNLLKILL